MTVISVEAVENEAAVMRIDARNEAHLGKAIVQDWRADMLLALRAALTEAEADRDNWIRACNLSVQENAHLKSSLPEAARAFYGLIDNLPVTEADHLLGAMRDVLNRSDLHLEEITEALCEGCAGGT